MNKLLSSIVLSSFLGITACDVVVREIDGQRVVLQQFGKRASMTVYSKDKKEVFDDYNGNGVIGDETKEGYWVYTSEHDYKFYRQKVYGEVHGDYKQVHDWPAITEVTGKPELYEATLRYQELKKKLR